MQIVCEYWSEQIISDREQCADIVIRKQSDQMEKKRRKQAILRQKYTKVIEGISNQPLAIYLSQFVQFRFENDSFSVDSNLLKEKCDLEMSDQLVLQVSVLFILVIVIVSNILPFWSFQGCPKET